MKYNKSKFYILNIVLLFALLITISNVLTAPDYSINLREFLKNEDSKDLEKVLNSYSFPVKNYWNQQNITKSDLKKAYANAWEKVEYSRNYVVEIEKLNNFNFILTTQFIYKLKKKKNESTVRSKLNFKLNNDGKIVSIENLELISPSGATIIEINEFEKNEFQKIYSYIRTYRDSLVVSFFIIVLNVWWFISYRSFETKRKERELIEEEKERLAKIEEERQWLIRTIKIDTIEDEKDAEILKLIERLKALNSGVENNYAVYKKAELIELIKKKHLSNLKQEKERREKLEKVRLAKIEKERLAKLERERLERIENERLAKIEKEYQKEKRRRLKIQREKERKKLEKTRKEKEKQEKERLDRERLALIEENHRIEKERILANQIEKERLEATKKAIIKKSPSNDLSQYMGEIDEEILKEEKLKGGQNKELRKYLKDGL